jgi:hypothetical protein
MRLIFGGASILIEGDDSAGIATTLTISNYHIGNAGTMHHQMYSPIVKAGSSMCNQRSDGKRTYK